MTSLDGEVASLKLTFSNIQIYGNGREIGHTFVTESVTIQKHSVSDQDPN
jgi:hypothetical protein